MSIPSYIGIHTVALRILSIYHIQHIFTSGHPFLSLHIPNELGKSEFGTCFAPCFVYTLSLFAVCKHLTSFIQIPQVRLASIFESSLNAVERIDEFCHLTEEAPAVVPGSKPDGWPSAGKVCFSPRFPLCPPPTLFCRGKS